MNNLTNKRRWMLFGAGALLCILIAGAAWSMYSSIVNASNATLYAMPLVAVDLTRQESNALPNQLYNFTTLQDASSTAVVRPNVDTLYSIAFLDLSSEPVIMTVPPSNGRFFMLEFLDAWTNVFADPGIRTLGNNAATYALVGPDWHGGSPRMAFR